MGYRSESRPSEASSRNQWREWPQWTCPTSVFKRRPPAQQGDSLRDILDDPQVECDVVPRTGGDDAEGCVLTDHGPYDTVDRPVAACHDDQFDARLDGIAHDGLNLAVRADGIDLGQDIVVLHLRKIVASC